MIVMIVGGMMAALALIMLCLLGWALDLRRDLRANKARLGRELAEFELERWKRDYPELTCRPDRRCDANKQL